MMKPHLFDNFFGANIKFPPSPTLAGGSHHRTPHAASTKPRSVPVHVLLLEARQGGTRGRVNVNRRQGPLARGEKENVKSPTPALR